MDREEGIPVDATLEGDIEEVEQAVARYLGDATDAPRPRCWRPWSVWMIGRIRVITYQNSVIGSAAIGFASKGEVLGETNLDPLSTRFRRTN